MMTRKAAAKFLSFMLSFMLLITGLAIPGQAQNPPPNRVIIINADQPNVWTLEQAHYLLAQMHRRNLDLKAKSLEDLDPNEISGLRFDVMRMLIEFGATFNQADLASNRIFSRNQEFNTHRREELTAERDRLRKESLTLTGEIDELETKKAEAETDEEKARWTDSQPDYPMTLVRPLFRTRNRAMPRMTARLANNARHCVARLFVLAYRHPNHT